MTTLLRTEAAELSARLGFGHAQAWTIHLLVLALFGGVPPFLKGLDYFDPLILGVYVCLGAVFAAPASASGPAVTSMASAHARLFVCVAYGEGMAFGMTALGIATVYFSHRNGLFFPPALDSLAAAAVFGFLLTTALSTMTLWLSLRYSPGVSKLLLRVAFLALLVWIFLYGRSLFIGFVLKNLALLVAAEIAFWIALRAAVAKRASA